MSEIIDKKHWYDGWFYAKFIDPWEKELNEIIANFIEGDSTVIDIGCGTGALAFLLSQKCKHVVGIELSLKMLRYANKQKEKGNFSNLEFIYADATSLSETIEQPFDYATASLVLHEMPTEIRAKAINEMKRVSKKIIISDYIAPQPKGFWGRLNAVAERMAGAEHFKNFSSFVSQEGIDRLLSQCRLNVEQEQIDKASGTCKIVKASQ